MPQLVRRLAFVAFATLALWVHAATAAVTPLVDVDWVRDNGARAGVVILDIRNKLDGGSREAYVAGHIPGAVYSNYLRAGWRATVDGVPGQLAPIASLEALIGGLGIDNDSRVVIVAGGTSALDMGSATRIYWTFKVLGHDRVSILDGGYRAYAGDPANPIETGWNAPTPTVFKARFRPEMVADYKQVMAAMKRGTALVDVRPPPQYRGESNPAATARAGTIPGARNVPESLLTVDGGRFIGAGRVQELLRAVGIGADDGALAFCNTGHWATLGWFVRSEILGDKNIKVYDGSMVDWSARPELPVENKFRKQ